MSPLWVVARKKPDATRVRGRRLASRTCPRGSSLLKQAGDPDQNYRAHKCHKDGADHPTAAGPDSQKPEDPAADDPAENSENDVDGDPVAAALHHLASKPPCDQAYQDPSEKSHRASLSALQPEVGSPEARAIPRMSLAGPQFRAARGGSVVLRVVVPAIVLVRMPAPLMRLLARAAALTIRRAGRARTGL